MTDDHPSPSVPQAPPETVTKKRGAASIALILVLVIIAAASLGLLAVESWPLIQKQAMHQDSGDVTALRQRTDELERKTEALDTRMNELNTRMDTIASVSSTAAPTPAAPQASKVSAADFLRMQGDLAALAETVKELQAGLKQAGSKAAETRAELQASLAETIAFMQLRAAAITDRGFTQELAALRAAAKSDSSFDDLLAKLTPYAENGTPSFALLRAQLSDQAAIAERAITTAKAQNWWERVLAELKGLVSIRPLHGAGVQDDTFTAMESDLAHDDLSAALDAMKNLPPEAQKVLGDWRAKAEARQAVDETLRAMADRITSKATQTPAAQDSP